jgi:tRNA G37 N-methylase Trm5
LKDLSRESPAALSALKDSGGSIHYRDFIYAGKGEDPVMKARTNLLATAEEPRVAVGVLHGHVVRTIGPRWYHVVLDMKVNGTES